MTTTIAVSGATETQKKNRIQVSNTKKPLFFYVNLAKVFMNRSLVHFDLVTLSEDLGFTRFLFGSREMESKCVM